MRATSMWSSGRKDLKRTLLLAVKMHFEFRGVMRHMTARQAYLIFALKIILGFYSN